MLPRLPRRADALLRADRRRDRRRRDRLLAARRGVRDPPADAGDDPGGDPARRLRRRRRAAAGAAARRCSATLLAETASPRAQLLGLATRRFGGARALGQVRGAAEARSTSCSTPRSPSTARDADLEERDDILSMLMLARFEDGEAMTDTELRDQLMTLLLAGHETTATALAWTFDLLLRHPARAAAPARLARGRRGRLPAGDDLRVAAPAPGGAAGRPAPRQGARRRRPRRCRPGTDVTPAIWLTHTRADVYPEPFAFRPERFLDERPRHLRLDPLRRRHPPLPRRRLRRVRDADRAARGARPAASCTRPDPAPERDRPPQHHPLAPRRHPGGRHRAPPGARARRSVAA